MHIVDAWGTGILRLITACKQYGLQEPTFEEFGAGIKVTIYRTQADKRASGLNGTPVSTPVNTPVSTLVNTLDTVDRTLVDIYEKILSFCIEAKGILEIADMLGYKEKKSVRKYLNPLIAAGCIAMTIPDKPNSKNQKYITIKQ